MPSAEHAGQFRAGDPRTRKLASKGGKMKAAKAGGWYPPYEGTILDIMDEAGLTAETWDPWRTFWRATFALPMDDADVTLYRRHTERDEWPEEQVDEVWMPVGRRGGKSHNAGLAGLFLGIRFDTSTLAPGEVAVVMILAADRRQARAVLGYLKGLAKLPAFERYVFRTLKESVELENGVRVEVHTANYRTVRGYTVVGCVCDEVAFWPADESSANPDSEILAAIRPAMATVPGSLLLGFSSPYATRGELYRAVDRYFGQSDPHILVWNADSRSMNPGLPDRVVERAFEEDPVAAASEYGRDGRVVFRRDVEAFLDPEAIRAVTVDARRELTPRDTVRYTAFVDPSGGSQDSMTLAIAHAEGDLGILDAVREVRPPFSPDNVVADFAELLRTYRISKVTGDRYGGEWPAERFRVHGIKYEPSRLTKSDLYKELLAPTNSGNVVLLDLPVLRAQLVGLERKVARGGRDSIDHAPGGRDDVANAAAGALVLTRPRVRSKKRFAVR